jgi:hypothetical protein
MDSTSRYLWTNWILRLRYQYDLNYILEFYDRKQEFYNQNKEAYLTQMKEKQNAK